MRSLHLPASLALAYCNEELYPPLQESIHEAKVGLLPLPPHVLLAVRACNVLSADILYPRSLEMLILLTQTWCR